MRVCAKAVSCFRALVWVFIAWAPTANVFHVIVSQAAAGQESPPAPSASGDAAQGKHLFEQNCSVCHGLDGSGAEGPDLHGVSTSLGDRGVQDIIRRGIPGTAMPGSYSISDKQAADIAAYVRTLGTTEASGTATGDAKKGEALYQSSGCSACHMIEGEGGSVGPDLTRIGSMRGPSNLMARLEDPGANLPKVGNGPFEGRWTQYLMYRAVERNGHVIEGVRVGEDSFTIVLKDASGKFHGLRKPELRSLEKEPGKSFMPSYKETLSEAQLNDLVAYLTSLKAAMKGTP
jgi:cytochrome c oxidase cbb3-type subunit III